VIAISDIWDRKDKQLIFFFGRAAAYRPAIAAGLQDLCIVTMTLNDLEVLEVEGVSVVVAARQDKTALVTESSGEAPQIFWTRTSNFGLIVENTTLAESD
jgi:hypothetical protein